MALKLNDGELSCYAIDDDAAVIRVKHQDFVVDYSTLIDFLTDLAAVASQVEAAAINAAAGSRPSADEPDEEICSCQRLH